ncbi:Uncharacterized protein FWK35_00017872 [Aphis craccivora]|uniref:Uncharacterized protein n=1 Tax=Aphis craccivora TaxID=307492 RepID=A0A6G0ZQB0_APHCR|nr:Uncharacterized protein FWK35_00017872 [Aphis craccivora]
MSHNSVTVVGEEAKRLSCSSYITPVATRPPNVLMDAPFGRMTSTLKNGPKLMIARADRVAFSFVLEFKNKKKKNIIFLRRTTRTRRQRRIIRVPQQ